MPKVIVASKNPVKISATADGFLRMFPGQTFEVEGYSVPSGVPDQPMGNIETFTGALNRAVNAMAEYPDAQYWVGHEGGCEIIEDEICSYAWVIIKSRDITGKGKTTTFFLPPKVAELVTTGTELGLANDMVFGSKNSKQKGGAIGLLTDNALTRKEVYANAVVMALAPFKNPQLYTN